MLLYTLILSTYLHFVALKMSPADIENPILFSLFFLVLG